MAKSNCNAEYNQHFIVLVKNDIERRLTVLHTPQQNRVAERFNQTLQDMARCLI